MQDATIGSPKQVPLDMLVGRGTGLESKARAAQSLAGDKQKGELKKVSQEFEAVFVAYLLKVMRETIEESGLMEEGFGKSIYTEMFDQEVSLSIARKGSLGISDLLYRNLSQAGTTEDSQPSNAGHEVEGASPQTSLPATQTVPDEGQDISDLQLPVSGSISSSYGLRKDPFSRQLRAHKGLDIAAPEGMKIVAALPGTVLRAGYESGFGNSVLVQHSGGLQTRYAHLESVSVNPGDTVSSQQVLGTVGKTGRSTGPHLHFEVIRMGVPIDPLPEIGSQFALRKENAGKLKTGS
jgi:murein DD-endopeptidase MepM/ murein hydrolase activator NlpD